MFNMKLARKILAIVCFVTTLPALAGILSFEKLDVDSDYQYIDANIKVSNLAKTDIDEQAELNEQLAIFLGKESKPIANSEGSDVEEDVFGDFYWQILSEPHLEIQANRYYTLLYSIRILPNKLYNAEASFKALKSENAGIPVFAQFWKGDREVTDKVAAKATIFHHKPAEAPENFRVWPSHKSLFVGWTSKDKVQATAANQKLSPTKVLIMLFHPGTTAVDLKAAIVDNQTGKHRETICHYDAGTSPCISCEGEGDIFIHDKQEELEGVSFFLVKNAPKGNVELIPAPMVGEEYTLVLQYQDGTRRTECAHMAPITTLSLTEANGETSGNFTDPRCFVATAAYGSSLHPHVEALRWFRDTFLMRFKAGQDLVIYYYEKSPYLAEQIGQTSSLRLIARSLLFIPVAAAMGLRFASENPLIASLALLLATILVGAVLKHVKASAMQPRRARRKVF